MTYKEIQDRLSKCEDTLQSLKNGSFKNLSNKDTKVKIQKLNTLQESLKKQLKELDNAIITTKRGETKIVTGVNDKAVNQLKRDPNIDSIEKTDGTEIKEAGFDQNETAQIAAVVGKAVVLALNEIGENISTAKVKNIKPDNFEVRIVFRNDNEEVYKFYINEDDRLMLTNASYDRELADVGVNPSGAAVNVDVVKDAFKKELKDIMSETMSDDEFQDAKEKERLEKHPERDTIKKIQALIDKERRLRNTKEDYDPDQEQKDDEEEHGVAYYDDGTPIGEDALGFSDIEKLGSKAASDIDISVRRDPNYTFGKRPGDDDRLRYKYAKQLGYLKEEQPTVFDDESIDALRNIILKYVKDPDDAEKELDMLDYGGFDAMSPGIMAQLERDKDFQKWYDNLHNGADADTDYMQRRRAEKDYMQEGEYAADKYNVNVFGYQTKYFKICPGAKSFMDRVLAQQNDEENKEELIRLAKLHDLLFLYEIRALKDSKYAAKILKQAEYLASTIKDQVENMGLDVADVDYLDSHIEKIKDAAKGINEAPDNMYYFKVPKTDKAKLNAAQNTIETFYHPVEFADIVDDDGNGNVIFYIHKKDFNPGMIDDLQGDGIDLSSSNLPGVDEAELSKADKSKLKDMSKSLKKSSKGHAGQAKYIDKLVKEGRGDMDIIKGIIEDRANESGFSEREEAAEVIGGIADEYMISLESLKDYINEDMDVGHQDDEPSMLKSTAYESAAYAAKLYKKLAKYDQFDGEVDFPNWWQSKLILAKDYLSKAFHYIDSKEKQPMIDKLALENKQVKESPEQEDAINDLRNIVDQLEELGEEARDLVRQFFPNELSRLDGYRAFEFAYSSNRYDTTLGKFVDRLEDGDYDDLDDDDYPREGLDSDLPKGKHSIAKLQKVHGMIVDKMKELAKLYKEKGGEHEYRGHSVIDHLKSLTRKKKQVEDALDKAVSGKNRNQQLDPNVNEKKYRIGDKWSEDFDYKGMLTKAAKLAIPRKGPNEGGFKVLQALYDSFEDVNYHSENQHLGTAIDAYKNGDNEEGAKHLKMFKSAALDTLKGIDEGSIAERAPGFKHDCAAKVVHEKYGKGNCIPEKHTLVKEGNKYVVTHYDVLFESGKTVKDIPVSELDIKTSNEHWHKGYKKKGKK